MSDEQPDNDAAKARKRATYPRWFTLSLVAAACATAYLAFLHRTFEVDDALIYWRYVENAVSGEGLVYNPGERVNALTSPLFAYVLTAGAAVAGHVGGVSMALSTLCFIAAATILATLFARLDLAAAGAIGACIALSTPFFYLTFGMESTLFLALIALCLLSYEMQNYALFGICAALLLMTRGEGVFLLVAIAAEHALQKRRAPPWRSALAPALLLAAHALFQRAYYGSFLSSTLSAKMDQARSGVLGAWPVFARVGYHESVFFHDRAALFVLALVLAAAGWWHVRRSMPGRVAPLFLILYTLFYVVLNIPNYHWYYAPYYFFGAFFAGAGVYALAGPYSALVASPWRIGLRGTAVGAALILIAGGLWYTEAIASGRPEGAAAHQILGRKRYRLLAEWVRANTPADARIGAAEIGILGYYSGRHIVDIMGLVTPGNSAFLAEGNFGGWLEAGRPDYIVVHNPVWAVENGIVEPFNRGEFAIEEAYVDPQLVILRRATP